LRIFTQSDFFSQNQRALLMQGIYFGLILAMILYNAFLFFSLREYPYLLYILFTTSYLCFQGVLQGLFQQFFFDSVWLQNHTLLIFGYASILFANLFAVSFLKLRTNNPLLCHILRGIGVFSVLAAAFSSVLPYEIMVKMMLILAIPSSLLIMAAGIRLWWSGHLPARIFAIAWTTLLVSFVLASFNKFAIIPRTIWTEDIMQIGGVLEVILLSIALAERVNEEKRQRILVEQRLASSLEAEVLKRTEELNVALEQLESANAILDQISHTDSLTQIANRRAFDSEMINACRGARRENHPLALIILDIDHFKVFNDTHGHQAGDKALQEVAGVLAKHATRPGDKVFRYGGEEFAVLLKNTDFAGARVVAEKMRISIAERHIDIGGEMYSVTISGGIAFYDPRMDKQHAEGLDHLILRADKCLYQAKEKGRNRIELEES
jgi:two-component system, sensor histidine kinase LadS